jgi:hypothetical protein
MPLILSGSVDISGSMTATTIVVSSPGAAGMVSSSAQITELAPLMAYTASLKGAAIVSSSQQITNYYKFAETASANTFYGTQTITGSLNVTGSVFISGISPLEIRQSTNNRLIINSANIVNEPQISSLDSSNNPQYLTINSYDLKIKANGANALQVGSDGNVTVSTGNLIFSNGKGIDFSATANSGSTTPSEILSDYEEGTWTPVIRGGTTSGTYTYEAARTGGRYVKVGNVVTISGVVRINTITSAGTGYLQIGGFPFVPTNKLASSWGGSSVQLFIYGAGTNSSATTYPPPLIANMPTGDTFADIGSRGKNYNVPTVIGDVTAASWIYEIEGSYII